MGICNKCDQTVDYCDCIPQKYREQIAQEIEAEIAATSLGDGLFKSGMMGAVAIVRGKNA